MSKNKLNVDDDLIDHFLCSTILKSPKEIGPRDLIRVLAEAGGGTVKLKKWQEHTVIELETTRLRAEFIVSQTIAPDSTYSFIEFIPATQGRFDAK